MDANGCKIFLHELIKAKVFSYQSKSQFQVPLALLGPGGEMCFSMVYQSTHLTMYGRKRKYFKI